SITPSSVMKPVQTSSRVTVSPFSFGDGRRRCRWRQRRSAHDPRLGRNRRRPRGRGAPHDSASGGPVWETGRMTTATEARPGLRLGPHLVRTPVVLAPMAGITNAAFRQLCREQGAGLYVCEMITSRGIVERDRKTLQMLRFDPGEEIRSVQLYGVDPATMAAAAEILCAEFGVGHIDLNFGCPVPKVT